MLRLGVKINCLTGLKSDVGGWGFDIKFKATDPEARQHESY